MKYLLIVLLLAGCGSSSESYIEEVQQKEKPAEAVEPVIFDNTYIVAGQSNAKRCDWSYFEGMSGAEVTNISINGQSIESLIKLYKSDKVKGLNPVGIIFVHGETDGQIKTDVDSYIDSVELYRGMISSDIGRELPLYISTVGYFNGYPDVNFDELRYAIKKEAETNKYWNIAYDEAKSFRDWDLLIDDVHFKMEGCRLMMEGIYSFI